MTSKIETRVILLRRKSKKSAYYAHVNNDMQ